VSPVKPENQDKLEGQTMHTVSGQANFPTTRWTLIAAAGNIDEHGNRQALESLCEAYWYPLYAYVRRRGDSPEQAQDHTQAFFLRILEHGYFDRADREKGRFRSFLLCAFKAHLCDASDQAHAMKRGGGIRTLPFELPNGEQLYSREPVTGETPERIYERRWALTLLDRVMAHLREEFIRHGRLDHFNKIKFALLGETSVPYAALARELDTNEAALKVGIHRLRKRYRELLRAEVADVVLHPADVDSELRYLISALSAK
jgi:RNA polymerase sigma-70 factor (ECF subfamily)